MSTAVEATVPASMPAVPGTPVTPERATLAWADPQYEDATLAEGARRSADGAWYELHRTDGWSLSVPYAPDAPTAAGTRLRCWGRGIGYPVRGVALGAVLLRYETAEEERARFAAEQAARQAEQRALYEASRDDTTRRVAALPPEFQARIARFRANNPDFDWQYLPCELFVCEQAVAFASALGSADAIRDFHALPYDEQRARVPAMDDGHSGNTFGAACTLATVYLTQPEDVARVHGALSPLVGSQAYGDVPRADVLASAADSPPGPEGVS